MRKLMVWTSMAVLAALSGCASFVAPEYSADYAAVDALKRQSLKPASVGKVQPEDPAAKVNNITLRGTKLASPAGTFALYVEQALIRDLTEAGLYDKAAGKRIDMRLLRNDIDVSGFSSGEGDIAVEVTVVNGGATLFKKQFDTKTNFDSSFAGAVAIPKGQSEYPRLVREMLSLMYRDAGLIAALK
jgi:hypothetical protein